MPDAVIVAAARSPIGKAHKGSLRSFRPDDLGAAMVQAALDQVPELAPESIDDLIMGCAQPAGEQGYNIGRMVGLRLGLDSVPATTVHRYCASSLQATRIALGGIRSGEGEVFVAAGVEMVSRYPQGKADGMPDTRNPCYEGAAHRTAIRAKDAAAQWTDPRADGELPDVYIGMGETAENVAQLCGVSRREQDEWAVMSHQRAEAAAARGFWATDITPVTTPDGTTVTADDGPRPGVTLDKVAQLAPVFREHGTVTAANCCPLNDGAAALVLMSDARARELGVRPLARVLATGLAALSPEIMGLGPVESSNRALARAGLGAGDIDLWEINEAFAAQVVPSVRQLGIDPARVNVNGGAIALGHPFGMTGARLVTTLIHSLEERDEEHGVVTMCAAGGQGMALVLQRLGA